MYMHCPKNNSSVYHFVICGKLTRADSSLQGLQCHTIEDLPFVTARYSV